MKLQINNTILIKAGIFICLIIFYFSTRYYHSFFFNTSGYGSGDAYGIMLNAYNVESSKYNSTLISYFYKIFHDFLGISYYTLSFYITPLIGLGIVLTLFDLIRRKFGFFTSVITMFILLLNPWLAYHSTEPSKEIFVLFFTIISFYSLLRFGDSANKNWLIVSFIFISLGVLFYHSILLFVPFYLLFVSALVFKVYKEKKPLKHLFFYLILLGIMGAIIAGPQLVLKETYRSEVVSNKPSELKSSVDEQGSIFERQLGGMTYALLHDRSKLGAGNLLTGVENFLVNQNAFIYLFTLTAIVSFYFILKKGIYTTVLLSLLTIYIFIIIGIQWTSYSHGSRYPQYIVYFLLTCASLPIGFAINLLPGKHLKIISVFFLITSAIFISNPFLKVGNYRDIYSSHQQLGRVMRENQIQVDKDHQLMYLGWPSITLSVQEGYQLSNSEYLNTFGWDLVDLEGITSKDYVTRKRIKYFISDENGSDYFNSNQKVQELLKKNFTLRKIATAESNGRSNIIYQIEY